MKIKSLFTLKSVYSFAVIMLVLETFDVIDVLTVYYIYTISIIFDLRAVLGCMIRFQSKQGLKFQSVPHIKHHMASEDFFKTMS